VPMLSFEVWYEVYQDEVDRAIRVMYLSYWLQNKAADAEAKAAALEEGRKKLAAETVQFKLDYEDIADIIGPLEDQANNIVTKVGGCDEAGCWGLLGELKDKEAELLDRADRIVEQRHKVPWWKAGLKAIATSYKATFEYGLQGAGAGPYGALAGAAYGRIKGTYQGVTDLFASQEPWKSASAITTVADQFDTISTDFGQAHDECFAVFDSIDPDPDVALADIVGDPNSYLDALKDSTRQIAGGLHDVKDALTATALDNKEVEKELMKLKASDPTFARLVDQATELMVEKQIFNRQLAAAMQKISLLSNGITNNILAIGATNREASNRVVDRRALMYVKDMERRARARLLKYHYYMAKAYEYRLLQRYTEPLDIHDVFEQIVAIAEDPCDTVDGILGTTDYNIIKAVYDDLFSNITEDILAVYDYVDEDTIVREIYLSDEQLAQLNAGQIVTLDLIDEVGIPTENVRVTDMNVVQNALEGYPDDDNCDTANAMVTLTMLHSGVGYLQKDNETYQFRYSDDASRLWASDCYFDDTHQNSAESPAVESLLKIILGLSNDEVMFYSRPALWADITVTPDFLWKLNCTDYEFTTLKLGIRYDYTYRPEDYVTLRVSTSPAELRPYFIVDTPDDSEAGRQDGVGDFYRSYWKGSHVTVTAPASYGDYEFTEWYPRYDGRDANDPVLEVVLPGEGRKRYPVVALYVYDGPVLSGDINVDLNVDFRDYSALAAAWLTELGDWGWDEYCDISDPVDYVIDEFDLMVLCDDWLATSP